MARILRKIEIGEISAVDKPAQKHARAVIMKRHTETPAELVGLIQKAVTAGEIDHVQKHDYIAAITERANELRVAGDTDAQAFTKAITTDEPCKLLFKLMKSAPGSEVVFPVNNDAPQDYVGHNPKDEAVRAILEGAKRVQEEARTKSIVLSDAQAFDRYYNGPQNRKEKEAFDRAVALWRVKSPQQ
jgi:hypothetical protein